MMRNGRSLIFSNRVNPFATFPDASHADRRHLNRVDRRVREKLNHRVEFGIESPVHLFGQDLASCSKFSAACEERDITLAGHARFIRAIVASRSG